MTYRIVSKKIVKMNYIKKSSRLDGGDGADVVVENWSFKLDSQNCVLHYGTPR